MPRIHPAARVAYDEALMEREEQEAADAAEAEQLYLDCEMTFAYDERHDFIDDERYTLEDDKLEPFDPYPGPGWFDDLLGDDTEGSRLPAIYRY